MLSALQTPLQGSENDPKFKVHSGNEDPKGFGHIGFAVPDVESACKVRPYPTLSLMPTRCLISTWNTWQHSDAQTWCALHTNVCMGWTRAARLAMHNCA